MNAVPGVCNPFDLQYDAVGNNKYGDLRVIAANTTDAEFAELCGDILARSKTGELAFHVATPKAAATGRTFRLAGQGLALGCPAASCHGSVRGREAAVLAADERLAGGQRDKEKMR